MNNPATPFYLSRRRGTPKPASPTTVFHSLPGCNGARDFLFGRLAVCLGLRSGAAFFKVVELPSLSVCEESLKSRLPYQGDQESKPGKQDLEPSIYTRFSYVTEFGVPRAARRGVLRRDHLGLIRANPNPPARTTSRCSKGRGDNATPTRYPRYPTLINYTL